MPKIVLSSTNEAKKQAVINVAKNKFQDFELVCLDVDSQVNPTPFSAQECMQGCINRANEAKLKTPEADYWVGAEGGLNKFRDRYFLGGWVLVENAQGVQNWGSGSWVQIPDDIMENLTSDKRLNEVLDYSKFSQELVENKSVLGTNGLLTMGVYTRVDEFNDALKIAFSQF